MRLLNTASLQLEEFADNEIPEYGILSHTWEKEEVSYQEWQGGKVQGKAGYAKIVRCCKQAASRADRLSYVWIDTCCIDKTSSAELTEAINSMFQWYKNAAKCYAYLADVPTLDLVAAKDSHFRKSRWFTRGWTLQELIAPAELTFYSQDWEAIGTKGYLEETVSSITGVDVAILSGLIGPEEISIAKRMSWASKRKTTRVEDLSYCLMGLFDVNMPLLYGEGEKAFFRLQEEIMKQSDDHSLFAWKEWYHSREHPRGMLARSPAQFSDSSNIVRLKASKWSSPHSITNQGLRIELVLKPSSMSTSNIKIYLAALDCANGLNSLGPVGIYLRRLSVVDGKQYARVYCNELPCIGTFGTISNDLLPVETLYVRQLAIIREPLTKPHPAFRFHVPESEEYYGSSPYNLQINGSNRYNNWHYYLRAVYPEEHWDPVERILMLPGHATGIAGVFLCKCVLNDYYFTVVVGVNCDFCVTVRLHIVSPDSVVEGWKKAFSENENLLRLDASTRSGNTTLTALNAPPTETEERDNFSISSFTSTNSLDFSPREGENFFAGSLTSINRPYADPRERITVDVVEERIKERRMYRLKIISHVWEDRLGFQKPPVQTTVT